MIFGQGATLLLYAIATVIGLGLGGYLYQYREKPGVAPLSGSMFATALFSGPLFVATATNSYTLSVLMNQLLYVGVCLSVFFALLFSLEYTGREQLVTPKIIALLSLHPLLVVTLAFTNPGNNFFETVAYAPSAPMGIYLEPGIWFIIHTAYSYLAMGVVTAVLFTFLYTSQSIYRGQAVALMGGVLLPWIANAAYIFELVAIDTTPLGYVGMGILYTVAIVHYQFVDIMPIARDRVIDSVAEGVFVIDRDERLVDVNPIGREMIGADPETTVIGSEIYSLFDVDSDVESHIRELLATPTESTTELSDDGRHFEVQVTPITDGRDRHVGWLTLVYDVTARKRRTEKLETQNERLEQFADLVSHDLRNPLSVATGYLDLAREAESNEEYLDRIDESHDRMEAIIDDVLALARSGQDVTDPQSVALEELATQSWSGVETGDAALEIYSSATVDADPAQARRLLENLFRNAIEHAQPVTGDNSCSDDGASSLVVTVGFDHSDEHGPLFYVEDNGPGIPSAEREQIFEDGYTTAENNTGLGLGIVHQIAMAHDWSVAATAGTAGGARFEIRELEGAAATSDDRDAPATTTHSL